jgi:hypothetical protein
MRIDVNECKCGCGCEHTCIHTHTHVLIHTHTHHSREVPEEEDDDHTFAQGSAVPTRVVYGSVRIPSRTRSRDRGRPVLHSVKWSV